jgi:hypothetical protein
LPPKIKCSLPSSHLLKNLQQSPKYREFIKWREKYYKRLDQLSRIRGPQKIDSALILRKHEEITGKKADEHTADKESDTIQMMEPVSSFFEEYREKNLEYKLKNNRTFMHNVSYHLIVAIGSLKEVFKLSSLSEQSLLRKNYNQLKEARNYFAHSDYVRELVGFPLEKEMKKCADALDYLEGELKKL